MYETRFSAHNFKQPNASEKYVKFSIIYLGPKLWDNYLLTAEKLLSSLNEGILLSMLLSN